MRVELTAGGRVPAGGFLEVRFDGTYAASPMNELRVCTGTLDAATRDTWIALIERSGAFAREGPQGSSHVTHADVTTVRVASEDGLATRFTFTGGGDAALAGFADGVEAFWGTLNPETCAPATLDPATTDLSTWIHPFDLRDEARGWARLEVAPGGAVRAAFDYGWTEGHELQPCLPLADSEPLWATVLASMPFDVRHPDGWREVGVSVSTDVTADDGSTHERWVYGWMQSSRPEQVALQDALVALAETHCPP